MSFGIDKCKKITIIREKVTATSNIVLENGEEIKSLIIYYEYLWFSEREATRTKTKVDDGVLSASVESPKDTVEQQKRTINSISAYQSTQMQHLH